jgi:CDGSH-type Zn-finger protein/uncharacterized Fe-S cluster protein YjdI
MGERIIHEYYGEAIDVQYEVRRCIHAEECVRGLPAVFDRNRRPWVLPDAAEAGEIVEVILRCPTGALHFKRKDGGAEEPVPEDNTISVRANGPHYVRGDVTLIRHDGEVLLKDTRAALCRCGSSHNKPFCDNSHRRIEFQDPGTRSAPVMQAGASPQTGTLTILPSLNGPLRLRGPVEIRGADGEVIFRGNRVLLCRCGGSQNKPFCDNTHKVIGFRSE